MLTERFKRHLGNELRIKTDIIGKSITIRARNQHRYTHRTYNLGNRTRYRGNLGIDEKNSLEIYSDADYSSWIHNEWDDPFITNAINNDRHKTQREIQDAVGKALRTAIREGFFK